MAPTRREAAAQDGIGRSLAPGSAPTDPTGSIPTVSPDLLNVGQNRLPGVVAIQTRRRQIFGLRQD